MLPLFLLGVVLLWMSSCKNDIANAGSSVLGEKDRIEVMVDTFGIRSYLHNVGGVYVVPDSMMLGEMDSKYGRLHADILTQFACPTGFEYPETAILDSVCLTLYYGSYFGDGKAPLSIMAYEMDRSTFEYSKPYPTDTNIFDFCSLEDSTRVLENMHVLVASRRTDSILQTTTKRYFTTVRCKMNERYAKHIFHDLRDFSSQEKFNKMFGGLYITSEFGGSTLLNVRDVSIMVYYSFSYKKAGRDTTVHDVKALYANHDVRQLGRFIYPKFKEDSAFLAKDSDTYNYVVSPVQISTCLSLPMDSITASIRRNVGDDRRAYVNRANLTLRVTNMYNGSKSNQTRDDWAQPAGYMLLVRSERAKEFFQNHNLPSDTLAIVSSLYANTDSTRGTYYTYTYDISYMLTEQLRRANPGDLKLLLIPVQVTSTKNSSGATVISKVSFDQSLTATQILSAQNPANPLKLEVVYSGF